MAMDMKDFLYKYFAVLNLMAMDEPVLARFNDWVAKKDFPNKHIKAWTTDFPQSTPGQWSKADLPDIKQLDDVEVENLYILLRDVFRSMAANKADFRDNGDAIKFVDKYFGPGKLFENTHIKNNVEQDIRRFIELLLNGNYIKLGYRQHSILAEVQRNRKSVNDSDVKEVVSDAVYEFASNVPDYENLISSQTLRGIIRALEPDNNVPDTKLDDLRKQAPEIFETLCKKSAIRDIFKNNDQHQTITRQIDQALSRTDYTGKINEANYIAPKYKDSRKNPQQWIDQKLKDTYNNVLKKYLTAHRDNVFIKKTSKTIFGAFDKAGLKPTDGLSALIDKSGEIVGKLRGKEPFDAADHLDWMTKKLKTYKDNGLGDEIDGALRWGYQMRRIINQLIKDAVKEGKVEQAKTAMEVLSVMQYGTFTSRTMDAINKTDLTLFSDGGLSWNKNEGIQFVTKAMDKTMKFGFQAAGYAITGLYNRARKIGTKFNNSGDLKTLADTEKTKIDAKRLKEETDKNDADADDDLVIQSNEPIAERVADYISRTYNLDIDEARQFIDNKEKDMKIQMQNMRESQEEMQNFQEKHNEYEQYKQIVDEVNNVASHIASAKNNRDKVMQDIANKRRELSSKPYIANLITGEVMGPEEEKQHEAKLLAELDNLKNLYGEKDSELARLQDIQSNPSVYRDPAQQKMNMLNADNTAYLDAERNFNAAQIEYNRLVNDGVYNDLNAKMTEYSNAQEKVDKARNDKQVRQDNWDKWDQNNKNNYLELMAYWDFLQTGKTKNLFRLSTKKLQDKMDKGRMQKLLSNYTRNYAA